jgi:hypothetical protein
MHFLGQSSGPIAIGLNKQDIKTLLKGRRLQAKGICIFWDGRHRGNDLKMLMKENNRITAMMDDVRDWKRIRPLRYRHERWGILMVKPDRKAGTRWQLIRFDDSVETLAVGLTESRAILWHWKQYRGIDFLLKKPEEVKP